MRIHRFSSYTELEGPALQLLREHMEGEFGAPHAVMLTGGRTPFALYERLASFPPSADAQLHLLISDERYVPVESPESNFGRLLPLVESLRLETWRVLRVATELPLADAAEGYDGDLEEYIAAGGRITLGLLGLGADGHVASLFDAADIRRGAGRWAIPVLRESGPDRISVTCDLLRRVERIVFLVAGTEKEEVIRRVEKDPHSVIALRALGDAPDAEIWYTEESAP